MPREEEQFTRMILSEDEVIQLLRNIPEHTPEGMRNRAIIELFYGCGLRTSELCNLKVTDVNLKDQTVTIIKGKLHDPGNLFLSMRGNPFNKVIINKSVIPSVTKNLKLDKHVSCYTFRDSVATHLLSHHLDIAYIAKLLGHASLRTTQRYAHVEIGDL
jgi:integrase/recombinase XerD